MKRTIFIKLGGSLITDKNKPYTARPRVISRLVGEIKKIIRKFPNDSFVIGNGGGSFPHTSANKYKTAGGYKNDRQKYGACLVENDAVRINRILIDEMLYQNIPAVGINPSSIMLSEKYISMEVIHHLIENKIVPVLFGDVVFDEALGCRIYSCDEVIEKVSKKIGGKKLIVSAGDYRGVLDEKGSVIGRINKKIYKKLVASKIVGESKSTDVTGGMKSKIETLLRSIGKDSESMIVDGRKENNLIKAVSGKDFIGTLIEN